ncbi:MAG TPA: MFS transporter [Ornithinibacter sp.]|uniref:MFS transporter n=1 Tax=Ornithinibacter sp. TaxID=2862748 RepID=UPI001B4DC7FC|nr:MFS transporter [Ornithinibacter sp.]MBP6524605.1 MFS transporter [Dermatophilaceae bacterium]MBU9943780.1 MFS transporter [Dermatophilaceae bacterium]HQV84083.1 MFS transporter [Ornithinibacter sp.]HQX88578.1 MFS transporter [Ornithinibacter sp.]HQZ09223.1 MFS transporter [Ornithinibacter sp.]
MDDQPALPRPTVNPWVVLVVGSLSAFMVFLDAQVLFVAFDDIRSSFPSVSFATMSWTLSAYTIALAAALVPAGRMADRYGRRRVFLIGLVAFTLASVLCAVAPSAGLLVAFRVIQALGAAALVPASLALVLSVFPPARVPVAVAVWGAIAALAAAVGPTAGALLVEAWDWRAVFLANVPVGAIALVLGIRLLPESREADRARFPDPLGIALLAGSLTLLALGIVQSDQWGWTAPATLAALAGGLLVLAAFVRRTLSVPHPALDLRIFARPSVRWANIATAAFTIGFTAMFFALIAASGVFLLTRLGDDPAYVTQLLPASLLSGLGVAMVIPQLTSAAVQGLPPDEFGAGAAVNQAIRQLGATFGVALIVAVLGTVTPTIAADAFGGVWAMLVICGVLTSVSAVSLPRRQPAVRAVAVPVVAGAPQ